MQKKIFEDQATMHEAYLAGGLSQVEEFYRARIIDLATLAAWQQIDTERHGGDEAAVAEGNRTLLFREQHDIIDRFYVQMLGHGGLEGSAFTYLLTLAGAPSVPGAHSYPERYPLTFAARLPLGRSARAHRWPTGTSRSSPTAGSSSTRTPCRNTSRSSARTQSRPGPW